ncbi:alpha/beta hydrolase-fold protein [Salipaludibacillus sp. LMS25]|jgi:predicted alpha/beta superfamily hydrolase|uniref:alpha/beta hydrolase n=1 Tax=Salipaludibacillus sp. LMS25 TaxID=2924031 RepID=UPI0020D1DDFA|nr:alpha/beta hydrolase-fold protein [Salipaludibacillus sp. LMS25]UTR16851.1 alpha/beta hydrolase-fold protein [Salipaludibacillus sp. LMS25]
MDLKSKVIINENFYSTVLENSRKIVIYLPRSYEKVLNKRFPTVYIHAGQRIFDPIKENEESWKVHKVADKLIKEKKIEEVIIIGIAHKRITDTNEFCHFISPDKHVRCSGLLYEKFIINELKPYIDSHYRTLPDCDNTALIGSSAGGLSTYHIGFRNPDIFGKIGLMSPFFVKVNDNDHSETKLYNEFGKKENLNIWIDIGGAEGMFLVRHVRNVADNLVKAGYKYGEELVYYQDPNGAHFEKDWGERVHLPLLYFFGDIGHPQSIILDGRNIVGLKGIEVKVNPIITYDSGFIMSHIDGEYIVSRPNILEIRRDGTIIPKNEGTSLVTFISKGLKATKEYKVIKELSECVNVSMTVNVPENTPENDHIYISTGMILNKVDNYQYEGNFKLPRDLACEFKFSRGFRLFEVKRDGSPMNNRKFKATKDLKLNYTVENWIDNQIEREEDV